MNMIDERVRKLREVMKAHGVDMYYIPTSDYHDSEYVNEYFRTRAYMSGFTGSAGVMVVTQDKAVVWSDGRYFIQAEKQLEGTCIDFYRLGEKGYPTVLEFIRDNLHDGDVLGFDGRVVSAVFGHNMEYVLSGKNITIAYDKDLVDEVWEDRPALPKEKVFLLAEKYAGKSMKEKVADVRESMKKSGANVHVLTSLDDIAWLLNIRGRDVASCPVVLSYVVLTEEALYFYVDEDKLDQEVVEYLKANDVTVKAYDAIYEDVKQFGKADGVLVDRERVNYALLKNMSRDVMMHYQHNPSELMKALKNETELENLRLCHIKDGAAVTKFMYWLKNNIGKIEITEVSAAEYLHACRKAIEGYIEVSFGTIAGYNANAAMMHYSATPENFSVLKPEGLLLVDSGGQYYTGTTDITRTFALGEVNPEWKKDFSTVLISVAQMSQAHFLEGCSGLNLDILARQPIWDRALDYKCGTGHGVGYLLSVHEGPHGLRWYQAFNRREDTPLREGMVVTNEPGIYIEGSHGIRIENEMIVRKGVNNEYGQFMYFETMTFAPIDLDMIDVDTLDARTKNWLNNYHKEVFEKISPYLNEEEKTWLKEYTRAI